MPSRSRRSSSTHGGADASSAAAAREPSSSQNPALSSHAQEGTPDWLHEVQGGSGNSVVAQILTGASLDDQESSLLFTEQAASRERGPTAGARRPDGGYTPDKDPDGLYGEVYDRHTERLKEGDLDTTLSSNMKQSVTDFVKNFEANKSRYTSVASATGVPAKLIAAIHWRESHGNFGTYLHQGDPLGKKAVHHPTNIPIFHEWEAAAKHALGQKKHIRDNLDMDENTTDAASIATFAEFYNGLGYHKGDRVSPYVYSGTEEYTAGKYVADGKFSATFRDKQVGVVGLVSAVDGMDVGADVNVDVNNPVTREDHWQDVVGGHKSLERGDYGEAVEILQEKLKALGYSVTVDGDYGSGLVKALRQFQTDKGMRADGVCGSVTAQVIDGRDPSTIVSPAWLAVLGGSQVLRKGMSDEAVGVLQSKLKEAGFLTGTIDAAFGAGTEKAVKAFQSSIGETPDGVVGKNTASRL